MAHRRYRQRLRAAFFQTLRQRGEYRLPQRVVVVARGERHQIAPVVRQRPAVGEYFAHRQDFAGGDVGRDAALPDDAQDGFAAKGHQHAAAGGNRLRVAVGEQADGGV